MGPPGATDGFAQLQPADLRLRPPPEYKSEKVAGAIEGEAAMLLESRIGQRFDAIVTGAGPKGTWVRVLAPPVEGRLVQGFEGIDVGHRIRVQLTHTDVEQGFIDFKRVD